MGCSKYGLEEEVPDSGLNPNPSQTKRKRKETERAKSKCLHTYRAAPFPKPLLLLDNHGSD